MPDSFSRQKRPHETVQAREAEHQLGLRALGAEGVFFGSHGLVHREVIFFRGSVSCCSSNLHYAAIPEAGLVIRMATVRVYYQPSPAHRWPGLEGVSTAFGCLVYRYRLIVVAIWAIVVLVAGRSPRGSFRCLERMGHRVASSRPPTPTPFWRSASGSIRGRSFLIYEDRQGQLLATDPRLQDYVEASVAGLRSLPEVSDVISRAQNPRQLAPDGHAAYVVVILHIGELISLPFAAVALLLVFRSVTAAILRCASDRYELPRLACPCPPPPAACHDHRALRC